MLWPSLHLQYLVTLTLLQETLPLKDLQESCAVTFAGVTGFRISDINEVENSEVMVHFESAC